MRIFQERFIIAKDLIEVIINERNNSKKIICENPNCITTYLEKYDITCEQPNNKKTKTYKL